MKLIKIGGSHYLRIPVEYVKVFDLYQKNFKIKVEDEGKTITFIMKKEDDKKEYI